MLRLKYVEMHRLSPAQNNLRVLTGKTAIYAYIKSFTIFNPSTRFNFQGEITMSQQHTKAEKRVRRKRYMERVRARIRAAKLDKKRK